MTDIKHIIGSYKRRT